MTLLELKVTKIALRNQLREYENIVANCNTCQKFDDSAGMCKQFAAAPPAEWRSGQVDCEHWIHDNVPF